MDFPLNIHRALALTTLILFTLLFLLPPDVTLYLVVEVLYFTAVSIGLGLLARYLYWRRRARSGMVGRKGLRLEAILTYVHASFGIATTLLFLLFILTFNPNLALPIDLLFYVAALLALTRLAKFTLLRSRPKPHRAVPM